MTEAECYPNNHAHNGKFDPNMSQMCLKMCPGSIRC